MKKTVTMVKSVNEKNPHPQAYEQALDDFGITELRSHLSNYADADFNAALMNLEEQELETLAAILIQRLTKNLKGKLIASYLNAIRHGDSDVICDPINLEIPPPSIDLPANFPNSVTPCYQEGDRVRWRSLTNNTDWGIVIGRYYTYAQHQCSWAVCYLVWLNEDSPSAAWTVTDTAWEEDLEAITDNGCEKSGVGEGTFPSCEASQPASPFHPEVHPAEPNGYTRLSQLSPVPPTTSRFVSNGRRSLEAKAFSFIPQSLRTSPGNYNPEGQDRTNPRTLTQQEENLIALYSNCQLAMTPRTFHSKWSVNYERLAAICDRSTSTVRRWFIRGCHYRRPSPTDLRHLAIMDFLLEHFEEIPSELRNLLCSSNPGH